jgi:hypothetical protein
MLILRHVAAIVAVDGSTRGGERRLQRDRERADV